MTYLRTVLALIVLLVGACAACASGQLEPLQPTSSDLISRSLKSSISLYDREGNTVCAGTRVTPNAVLTAYHCAVAASLPLIELELMDLFGADLNEVPAEKVVNQRVSYSTYRDVLAADKRKDRDRRLATVVRVDRHYDLALLQTADIGQAYVPVRSSELMVGEDVYAIGHPAGLEYTYSRGWIATPCRKADYLPKGCWSQVDMTVWGGSSGGGLYDSAGQLAGVASMMLKPGQGFFVPPQVVTKFLAT